MWYGKKKRKRSSTWFFWKGTSDSKEQSNLIKVKRLRDQDSVKSAVQIPVSSLLCSSSYNDWFFFPHVYLQQKSTGEDRTTKAKCKESYMIATKSKPEIWLQPTKELMTQASWKPVLLCQINCHIRWITCAKSLIPGKNMCEEPRRMYSCCLWIKWGHYHLMALLTFHREKQPQITHLSTV